MRNASILHPTPVWRNVLEAQFRSVGYAHRQTTIAFLLVMLAVTLLMSIYGLQRGEGVPFIPETALLVVLFAPLLSIAVWRGEYRFRHSYLASMPVDRMRHVLVKMAAGWAWLMVSTAVYVLFMLALAVVTGGEIGVDEMRAMAGDVPPGASPEEVAALARRWRTPAWQWTVFLMGPTVTYLIGSAVVLASSRTRWWLAGITIVWIFIILSDDVVMPLGAAEMFEMALLIVAEGRYGFETLVWGREGPILDLTTASGERVSIGRDTPLEVWLLTTLLWMSIAVASVAVVVRGDRRY